MIFAVMGIFTEDEIRYFKQLDERQQRLFAGLRAKILGHYGVKSVSEALGIHENTVRKGKAELDDLPAIPEKRIRKTGSGAKKKC
jgi:hypothetical protein